MTQISTDRLRWHECVVDLLSRSEAIADRDEDGRAVYFIFGWSGSLQFIDARGHLSTLSAGLGCVRMDGFSILGKSSLEIGRIVATTVESPTGTPRRIFATVTRSEPAGRHGQTIDCTIIDEPTHTDDQTVIFKVCQEYD
ncbi:MAG: hypothetical protein ACNA8P_04260 [Phycisphaerales bacterium]